MQTDKFGSKLARTIQNVIEFKQFMQQQNPVYVATKSWLVLNNTGFEEQI